MGEALFVGEFRSACLVGVRSAALIITLPKRKSTTRPTVFGVFGAAPNLESVFGIHREFG